MTFITAPGAPKTEMAFQRPELLAPAGSFDKMVVAIHYGADAIYCGGKRYSLRAHATNFDEEGLQEVIDYAHARNVKVYITVNIFAHEPDFEGLSDYLLSLRDLGVDGLIVSDPGIIAEAQRLVPEMRLHLSTQANVTNSASAMFWQGLGLSRLNLARELSLIEIAAIKEAMTTADGQTELEVFVHGALCISYSGRCLLSLYLTGRDANRGECAQPCRYHYALVEEKRPGQYFPIEEDDRGSYIFNAKDLCLLQQLPALIRIGVNSLKIEGRMKSLHYVGSVVRVYRAALDFLYAEKENADSGEIPDDLPAVYMEELGKVGTRGETDNFIMAPPTAAAMIYDTPRITQQYIPAGIVRRLFPASESCPHQKVEIEFRNPVKRGEVLEFMGRNLISFAFLIKEFRNQDGEQVERANSGDILQVSTAPSTLNWETNGLVRKKMA